MGVVSGWFEANKGYIRDTDKWTGDAFKNSKDTRRCPRIEYKKLVASLKAAQPYLFADFQDEQK
jgi:hypothetical protein